MLLIMISGKVFLLCAFSATSVAFTLPLIDNLTYPDMLELDYDMGLFEGDMILSPEQMLNLYSPSRNGLINEKYRWPDATVAYKISKKFSFIGKENIKRAMKTISSKSCVKFVEKPSANRHYVEFASGNGCYSHVGYQRTKQVINLSPICVLNFGSVLHEILHTLGFYHMHSSFDRDDYVTIMEDNISNNHLHNFNKYNNRKVTHFGVKYDYNSVMHYGRKAFSKNGEDTIVPKDPEAEIGQRKGPSEEDIKRLNHMYNC